jgi:dihydroflavonol-4-reductase
MTYRDFLATASTVLNRPFKMIKIPNILIIFFGLINSVIARIRSKPPQISLGIARLSLLNQYYSSKKAQRDFEYLPTPIDEAIQLSLDWFRENKYIS